MANLSKDAEAWEHVVRKVRTGAMPPVGRPRPDKAASRHLVTYLETELDRAAFANPNPGRVGLQRLNRAEYRNAIRDLLGVEIDAASMLPTDVAGHGFDNNADALTLSPALTERYLGAAAKISQMALARPRGLPLPETFFVPTDRDQGKTRERRPALRIPRRTGDALLLPGRRGISVRDAAERKRRRRRVRGHHGRTAPARRRHRQRESRDGDAGRAGVRARCRGGDPGAAGDYPREDRTKKILELLKFRVPVKAGLAHGAGLLRRQDICLCRRPVRPFAAARSISRGRRRAKISSLTITGPCPKRRRSAIPPSRAA